MFSVTLCQMIANNTRFLNWASTAYRRLSSENNTNYFDVFIRNLQTLGMEVLVGEDYFITAKMKHDRRKAHDTIIIAPARLAASPASSWLTGACLQRRLTEHCAIWVFDSKGMKQLLLGGFHVEEFCKEFEDRDD